MCALTIYAIRAALVLEVSAAEIVRQQDMRPLRKSSYELLLADKRLVILIGLPLQQLGDVPKKSHSCLWRVKLSRWSVSHFVIWCDCCVRVSFLLRAAV